jgi:hypothetical protein
MRTFNLHNQKPIVKTTHSNKSHVGTILFIIFASLGGAMLSAAAYLTFLALAKLFFA